MEFQSRQNHCASTLRRTHESMAVVFARISLVSDDTVTHQHMNACVKFCVWNNYSVACRLSFESHSILSLNIIRLFHFQIAFFLDHRVPSRKFRFGISCCTQRLGSSSSFSALRCHQSANYVFILVVCCFCFSCDLRLSSLLNSFKRFIINWLTKKT